MCAVSWNARQTPPNGGKTQAPQAAARAAEGSEQRLHRCRGQRADAARLDDAGHTSEVRRDRGRRGARAASSHEDTWHRAVELLFEHLAVRWTIAGAPIERQNELLERFRAATPQERAWVREALREHCAEHFPDVRAP